ncbi:hypothetical protein GCM10010377_55500 [Streptomyces viridiviolaceus]|nr:hypothetical protein GCM10010377_55500 [Streptomyces viridiviolaceus]
MQPGSSHVRVKNTDGNNEAFLVQRSGAPGAVGRLNGMVFQDFCIDGVASSKPYTPGNSKIGISVQSDNDAFRFEGMGFVYLEHAMIVRGADACSFTNSFVAECGSCISLTGASQVAKITHNYLISSWGGYSVFAENAEGILVSGNTVLWACNITLTNSNRCAISANKLLSNFPSTIALPNGSSGNLISGNHFRRVYGDGTSTRFDDLYGLVHVDGDDNAVTGNQFSFSVPAADITPSGADPAIILVAGGARNYLATNSITANVGVEVVLDASSTDAKILFSAQSSQLQAYTDDYALVATPRAGPPEHGHGSAAQLFRARAQAALEPRRPKSGRRLLADTRAHRVMTSPCGRPRSVSTSTPGAGRDLSSVLVGRQRVQLRQVDDDRLLRAPRDDHHGLLAGVRVLLAVRDERRDEDVVAGPGAQPHLFGLLARVVEEHELRVSADHVDGGLRLPVVVVRGGGGGGDMGLPHPQLLGADGLPADGGEAAHAACLRGVAVQGVGADVVQSGAQGRRRLTGEVVQVRVESFTGGRQRVAHGRDARAAPKRMSRGVHCASPAAMFPQC